jgi:hypothetical protein
MFVTLEKIAQTDPKYADVFLLENYAAFQNRCISLSLSLSLSLSCFGNFPLFVKNLDSGKIFFPFIIKSAD